MESKKEKLIIEGNAVYELDLECLREKEKKKSADSPRRDSKKCGQRS